MDHSFLGSSVHGILKARILEWEAIPLSRASSQPKDWTQISHIAGGFSEPPAKHNVNVTELGGGALRRCIDHKDKFNSVAQLGPTLCNPVDCSKPGSTVLDIAQTHVHPVSDTI